MALTTGTQGSSATPATDFYNTIATALTNAGWTHIGQKSAATMGTTDIVECWAHPATTVSSNVYTGCIVYIEVDNTNIRLRIRASEVFDDAATGSPASNIKFPTPGQGGSAGPTPTATYHKLDTYRSLFVAAPTAANTDSDVGWVQIPTSGGGFSYWLGADSTRVLVANNSGGATKWAVAGSLDYLGTGGGSGAVFLSGKANSQNDTVSWIPSSSDTASRGNVRCSREPLQASGVTGNFCFTTGPSWPFFPEISNPTLTQPATGSIVANSVYQSILVASPCFLHGVGYTGSQVYIFPRKQHSHLARMSDFVVFLSNGTEPTIGDTLTISGVVYVILGHADNMGNIASGWTAIAVRQAAF